MSVHGEITDLLEIKKRYDQAWRTDPERDAANLRWVTSAVEVLLRAELKRQADRAA